MKQTVQIILEYFEGHELCNSDGEYSEKENLTRAENIHEDFMESNYLDIYKYLDDNYKNLRQGKKCIKKVVYPSGDIQYFNKNGVLVKTDLGDIEIEYNPKRVTRKK